MQSNSITKFLGFNIVACFIGLALLGSCNKEDAKPVTVVDTTTTEPIPDVATVKTWLVDKKATDETAALFYNLKTMAKKHTLFGQQDATRQGYDFIDAPGRCDVKEVTGSYPAVVGSDFIFIATFDSGPWWDYQVVANHDQAIATYERGGINTFSWHYSNPVSKKSFYWSESPVGAVEKILPGEDSAKVFKGSLKTVANFIHSLQSGGVQVPIIFRPFHEMDGDWFWWGKGHCSPADYKKLYQFTVEYLRDSLDVHSVLYAWSPDRSASDETQYLNYYPGDKYVDVLGIDEYWDLQKGMTDPTVAGKKFKIVSDYAKKNNKLAAVTETGLINLTQNDWFTKMLLPALKYESNEIAYVLTWTNSSGGFWTPYKGHPGSADFNAFKNTSYVYFEDDLKQVYKIKQ